MRPSYASAANAVAVAVLLCECLTLVDCDPRVKIKQALDNTVVQGIKPSGLRIAVPDSAGVSLVSINANINVPIDIKEQGQLSKNVLQAKDGYWTLDDNSVTVKPGDVVFFWIYMSIDDENEQKSGNRVIKELVEPNCEPSPTTHNGKLACKGQLIFEENFDSLNYNTWKHTIQFAGDPDNEFTIYGAKPENSYSKDGLLHITPTILEENLLDAPMKLEGCTWTRNGKEFCERKPFSWDILPPARSAWLNTKSTFSFKYGRIDIRARAARGDWVLSKMWLEPQENAYGPYPFDSGSMEMMNVRGNADFREANGAHTGALRSTPKASIATCYRVLHIGRDRDLRGGKLFSDEMHLYSVIWTPEHIRALIDGEEVLAVTPPEGGFLNHGYFRENCENSPWKKGDFIAPFDKEFYINLGVKVGGRHNFPDGSVSNEHSKPWKDNESKIYLNFWKARNIFVPTWKHGLQVDYIKVWAH